MFSKKLSAVLVAVGVLSSTSALFNEINIKGAFADTIKQNVVYTKSDTSAVSKDDVKVTGADEEAYKKKSLDTLKNYFNISVEQSENFTFEADILNEKNAAGQEEQLLKDAKDLYDNKKISKDEYDQRISDYKEVCNYMKEELAQLKHGMIDTGWVTREGYDYKLYSVNFNENTKELEDVEVTEGDPTKKTEDDLLKISEDQLKNTAEDFLKKNKLGNIEKPKCILVKGTNLFYQDENDSTKKVKIGIDAYTGKVSSFSVNAYAEWKYNQAINKK
jgi:hypothetical protein